MTVIQRSLMAAGWVLAVLLIVSALAIWAGTLWRSPSDVSGAPPGPIAGGPSPLTDRHGAGGTDLAQAAARQLPTFYAVSGFSLVDQDQRTVTNQQLRGQAWIAAFIFTRCTGPCPLITRRMAALQKQIGEERVKLISFSVDPAYDTPAVLKVYARQAGADEKRWRFLTGDATAIYGVAASMKLAALPAGPATPIMHSTRLTLIDGAGEVRGYYDSSDEQAMKTLAVDAVWLGGGSDKN